MVCVCACVCVCVLTLLLFEFLAVHHDVVFAVFVATDTIILTTHSLAYYALHLEERKIKKKNLGNIAVGTKM